MSPQKRPAAATAAAESDLMPRPKKKRATDRWTGTTAEERKAIMRKVIDKRTAEQRARRIAALVATAPPFTAEQVARLTVLLSGHPIADAPDAPGAGTVAGDTLPLFSDAGTASGDT